MKQWNKGCVDYYVVHKIYYAFIWVFEFWVLNLFMI